MTPEAWQRVKAIFDAARELAPAERPADARRRVQGRGGETQ